MKLFAYKSLYTFMANPPRSFILCEAMETYGTEAESAKLSKYVSLTKHPTLQEATIIMDIVELNNALCLNSSSIKEIEFKD